MKCWWIFFHDWGKWESLWSESLYQRRVCNRCGLEQQRARY
jgi:hypothetical protein